jgi:glycosyltransferase involved in cell wall biosynthesis
MDQNMNTEPILSVIMPIYNGETYLKEAIESILKQTFLDFEFIIIDDGSTDDSRNIIQQFVDTRIKFIINETNLGLIATLNKAFELAKGKYIARMDQDDISLPLRFEKQVSFFENNPDYGLVGSWVNIIPTSHPPIHYHTDYNSIRFALAFYCPFIHPSVMIKKSVISELDVAYDQNFIHAEDFELWTRIILKTKACNLSEELLAYRVHDTQTSSIHKTHQIYLANQIKRKYIEQNLKSSSELFFDVFDMNEYKYDFSVKIRLITKLYNLDKENCFFGGLNLQNKLFVTWRSACLEAKKISFKDFILIISQSITFNYSFGLRQWIAIGKKIF